MLNIAHIREMMRFVALAVDDPLWANVCKRVDVPYDASLCFKGAYFNLTFMLEPMIDGFTDLAIQSYINQGVHHPDLNKYIKALERGFGPDHPYSKLLSS